MTLALAIAFVVGIIVGVAFPYVSERISSATPPVSDGCINWNYPEIPLNPSYEDCITRDFCNETNPIIKQNCRCCISKYGVCR